MKNNDDFRGEGDPGFGFIKFPKDLFQRVKAVRGLTKPGCFSCTTTVNVWRHRGRDEQHNVLSGAEREELRAFLNEAFRQQDLTFSGVIVTAYVRASSKVQEWCITVTIT